LGVVGRKSWKDQAGGHLLSAGAGARTISEEEIMDGMFVAGFGAFTDSEIAQSFSFHHEFEPTSMICELSLSMVDENADSTGSALWFTSFTFEDDDGTPHDVAIDFSAAVACVGHDKLRRCEWNMRIWNSHARGLFNAFFWPSVS
jgi:hypothetical protein